MDVRDYNRKKSAFLREQGKDGSFEYSPGTEDVRISTLQAEYRQTVAERYLRRFGKSVKMKRLDADHPIDMIAGGAADQALKMRRQGINRSIGSQLRIQAERMGLQGGDRFRVRFAN